MEFKGLNIPKHHLGAGFITACLSAKAMKCNRDCGKCIFADFDEYTIWNKAGRPNVKKRGDY